MAKDIEIVPAPAVTTDEKGSVFCKVQMAPESNEVEVTDDSIHTDWNGGITYKARLADIRKKYGDEYLKKSFSTAIFLCSKPWQLEQVLNRHFRKRGHIE